MRKVVDMMKTTIIASILALGLGGVFGASTEANAAEKETIRVYSLNKKGQAIRKKWVKRVNPGQCFSARKAHGVHRFAQLGYEFCELFSKKNCSPDQRVTAMWQGKHYRIAGKEIDTNLAQTQLGRGSKWILHPTQNINVQSIMCF